MKKILVLTACLSMLATSAFAGISGTPHDLTSKTTATDEICVFCHTPHGASADKVNAPLWNRTVVNATDVYSSLTFSGSGMTIDDVNVTDAPLCLSCHGSAAALATKVNNPPNNGSGDLSGLTFLNTNYIIDQTLSNDHPIGFSYDASVLADGTALVATATVEGTAIDFYGATNDMWCSSCHDVHNNSNGQFLNINNAGSDLCLTCHNK